MKYLQFTLLILLGLNLSGFTIHKFYVSVMEIHPNENEKKLEIILRSFPDDLEKAWEDYQKKYKIHLAFDEFVKKYVRQKIRFAINEKEVEYNILGMTNQDEYLVILLEVPYPKNQKLKSVHIENKFLLDEFDEQKNIIHWISPVSKKSYVLNKKNTLLKILL